MQRMRVYTVPAVAEDVEKLAAGTFGGYTSYQATGGWLPGNSAEVEVEPAVVVEILMDDDRKTLDAWFVQVVRDLAYQAGEQEIIVTQEEVVGRFLSGHSLSSNGPMGTS